MHLDVASEMSHVSCSIVAVIRFEFSSSHMYSFHMPWHLVFNSFIVTVREFTFYFCMEFINMIIKLLLGSMHGTPHVRFRAQVTNKRTKVVLTKVGCQTGCQTSFFKKRVIFSYAFLKWIFGWTKFWTVIRVWLYIQGSSYPQDWEFYEILNRFYRLHRGSQLQRA